VADSGDARRRPLVAGERKRESESEAEREKGVWGSRVLGTQLRPPLFVSFSLFLA